MSLLRMLADYDAEIHAEIERLRRERDEWKAKYSELSTEATQTTHLLTARTLQAALAGAFTTPEPVGEYEVWRDGDECRMKVRASSHQEAGESRDEAAPSQRLFPHASHGGPLRPVKSFKIGNRRLSLYWHENRVPSAAYSLYWDDERNPVQHAMTDREVFEVLAGILERCQDSGEGAIRLEAFQEVRAQLQASVVNGDWTVDDFDAWLNLKISRLTLLVGQFAGESDDDRSSS